MKRTALKRNTPLKAKAWLKSKVGLKSFGKKAQRQKKELDAIRPFLEARANGRCEHCGKHPQWVFMPDRPGIEPHHLAHDRSKNRPEDIIMLAPYCHDMYQCKPKDWEGWTDGKS